MYSVVTALAQCLPVWRRHIAVVVVVLLTSSFALYAWVDFSHSSVSPVSAPSEPVVHPARPTYPIFPTAPLANACNEVGQLDGNDTEKFRNEPIPNIVHYIWLLGNPAVLALDFRVFISVYSSHLFFTPDRIYFHTDATPEVWDKAKSSGDVWTRRVLNLPNVTPNYVETPRVTSKGVDIDTFGAKSDFIRGDVLRRFGGIYLDVDAIPLRDVAPLRHSGFANVVGGAFGLAIRQTGWVNTGVWLSKPHSNLGEIFYEAMDAFYNGKWAISVEILTDLAYRLHAIPGEVLIENPRAFAPMSWELLDQELLLKPHEKTPEWVDAAGQPKELKNSCLDALAWLAEPDRGSKRAGWEVDFSATYVLHAFDDEANKISGWDRKITLEYVLARKSNYALAVYPAVKHAIEANIITMDQTV